MQSDWLTTEEAAAYLKVERRARLKWVRQGKTMAEMQNTDSKRLTPLQADRQTLEQGWLYWLPNSPAPALPHPHWLKRAPISPILDLVERAATGSPNSESDGFLTRSRR